MSDQVVEHREFQMSSDFVDDLKDSLLIQVHLGSRTCIKYSDLLTITEMTYSTGKETGNSMKQPILEIKDVSVSWFPSKSLACQ